MMGFQVFLRFALLGSPSVRPSTQADTGHERVNKTQLDVATQVPWYQHQDTRSCGLSLLPSTSAGQNLFDRDQWYFSDYVSCCVWLIVISLFTVVWNFYSRKPCVIAVNKIIWPKHRDTPFTNYQNHEILLFSSSVHKSE